MINTTTLNDIGIRSAVGRSYLLVSVIIIFISIIGATYFNYINVKRLHIDDSQRKHEILTNLIAPALNIGDSTEIRRLLSLSSSTNEFYSVIDNSTLILLPDYSKLNIIKKIINLADILKSCKLNRGSYRLVNGKNYWVNCTEVVISDDFLSKKTIGYLVSVSDFTWYAISPMIIYFLATAIISLLLTITFLRHMLNKRIVRPLLQLTDHITNISKSPINSDPTLESFAAPSEVVAIKSAFDKVILELQNEYQQRTELTKREALLNMAASVAHDIRSPLAVMEITLSTINNHFSEAHLELLKGSIQSIRNIASNILERYRHSESTTTEKIFLADIVDQVVCQKSHEWQENPCDLSTSIAELAKSHHIDASPSDIMRVLSNLLNNSYEALNDNRTIHLNLVKASQYLILTIKDYGCGIPPDKLNDVLHGVSLKHTGTGLGLSGARRYMESIKGKLTLSSIYGKYSEVTLWFPIVA